MPVSTVVDGPLVSIVVVGRHNGSIDPGVRRALEQTTYRPIEILAPEAAAGTSRRHRDGGRDRPGRARVRPRRGR
jgi:hypothetical protein